MWVLATGVFTESLSDKVPFDDLTAQHRSVGVTSMADSCRWKFTRLSITLQILSRYCPFMSTGQMACTTDVQAGRFLEFLSDRLIGTARVQDISIERMANASYEVGERA